jgi:hypothetical protein
LWLGTFGLEVGWRLDLVDELASLECIDHILSARWGP